MGHTSSAQRSVSLARFSANTWNRKLTASTASYPIPRFLQPSQHDDVTHVNNVYTSKRHARQNVKHINARVSERCSRLVERTLKFATCCARHNVMCDVKTSHRNDANRSRSTRLDTSLLLGKRVWKFPRICDWCDGSDTARTAKVTFYRK